MADTKTLGPGKTFLFGPSSERTGFYAANPTDPGNYFWETDGSRLIYLWTGGAWLGPYTAAQVGLGGGGSSTITGAASSYVMSALAAPTYLVPQIIETNFAAKSVVFSTLQALVAAQPLLVGWSTSAGQGGAIGSDLNALATELQTPGTDTPIAYPNTKVLSTPQDLQEFSLEWDGTTTIKSVAVRSITANYTVHLEVVQ